MTYRDILVHVDHSDASPVRVATAVALATRCGAALHALCAVPNPSLPVYTDMAVPVEALEAEEDALRADLEAAERLFVTAAAGISSHCVARQGRIPELVAAESRYADLTIVGQHNGDDSRCTAGGLASALAFDAGSGVLVLPHSLSAPARFDTVVVAWNGAREGQRAVQDALPLLQAAGEVVVVHVAADDTENEAAEPAHRLCRRLESYDVNARALVLDGRNDDAGILLLDQCSALAAGLLVLGAYGHSRLREFLLGGVTREVLQQQDLPILISH